MRAVLWCTKAPWHVLLPTLQSLNKRCPDYRARFQTWPRCNAHCSTTWHRTGRHRSPLNPSNNSKRALTTRVSVHSQTIGSKVSVQTMFYLNLRDRSLVSFSRGLESGVSLQLWHFCVWELMISLVIISLDSCLKHVFVLDCIVAHCYWRHKTF